MSTLMEDDIKRWTAKRKTALVLDIIQGKTTVSEASRAYDLNPSEVEQWVDEGKRGMENALRSKPLEIKEQYERQLSDLQQAYGEAMLELRARKIARASRAGRLLAGLVCRRRRGRSRERGSCPDRCRTQRHRVACCGWPFAAPFYRTLPHQNEAWRRGGPSH